MGRHHDYSGTGRSGLCGVSGEMYSRMVSGMHAVDAEEQAWVGAVSASRHRSHDPPCT